MPDLRLLYFDFNGGRGEAARLAMAIGGVEFEDDRVPVDKWPEVKDSTPLGQLPVLYVGGEALTQTNSINRYVGKLAGLYPEDALEALKCDEVMSIIEEFMYQMVPTLFIQDEDEKRAAREALADGPLTKTVTALGKILDHRGGEYFADSRLTVADLKVFLFVRYLRSGMFEYVPTDIPDRLAPGLVSHFERISGHPGIVAWYEAHQ